MGILTDFVIAEANEAFRVAGSRAPAKKWTGFTTKDLDPVKLAMLLAIITKKEYRTELLDEFECLAEHSEDGPWVYGMPEEIVGKLAMLHDDQISTTARLWSEIAEFDRDGWKTSEVAKALKGIRDLARKCSDERKTLLVWVCL